MPRVATATAVLLTALLTVACGNNAPAEGEPGEPDDGPVPAEGTEPPAAEAEPAEPDTAESEAVESETVEEPPSPAEESGTAEPGDEGASDDDAAGGEEAADEGGATPAVDTIPDDGDAIDEPYVERLIDVTDPLIGEVMAQLEAADEPSEQLLADVSRVYEGTLASEVVTRIVEEDVDYVVAGTSGPASTELEELQTATTECISAVVVRDVTGYFDPPGEPARWNLTFVPGGDPDDTGSAWLVAREVVERDDEVDLRDGCEELS